VRLRLALVTSLVLPALVHAASHPVFSVSASWRGTPPAPGDSAEATVTVTVEPGWHLQSNAPLDPTLIPTKVSLTLPPGWTAEPPRFPPHRTVKLPFSDEPLAVFEGTFDVSVRVHRDATATQDTLSGVVVGQACNDSSCLPPADVPFRLAAAQTGAVRGPLASGAPPAMRADASPPVGQRGNGGGKQGLWRTFQSAGLLLRLGIAFVIGLGLNLTPCVYPLIPITIGFFLAQKENTRVPTWVLALGYVLGIAVTYSALGLAAALAGRVFGAAMQSPWVVGGIAVVLLALAASMFGLWELRVPSWAMRASGGRAGVGGAAVMGLAVGLVAAPCVGPFVAGLVTYVAQKQDPALGVALFFSLSLGLGVPYLLLGIFTRAIDRLPASGAWMVAVRQLFGVLLVGLAAYFVAPFLPGETGRLVMGLILVLGGLYLLVVARPGHEQPAVDRFMRLLSAAVIVAGVVVVPAGRPASAPSWRPYDKAAVEEATAAGRPVLIDFTAAWCLPCKELDARTFSQADVSAALERFALFRVDLTTNDPSSEAVRRRFDVVGPPAVVLLVHGRERSDLRLTGFEPPDAFLARLDRALGD
jgi:thiol:disulfide interchange protein DsbD